MTKHDLIDAYASGRIGRRDFMGRLTAAGVSAGAALAYAHTLAPSASAAGNPGAGGFVMRFQDEDGEYAGPILGFPETVGEAIEAVAAFLAGALGALQDLLGAFAGDDFDFLAIAVEDFLTTLQGFADELEEQLSVLESSATVANPVAKSGRTFAAKRLAQTEDTASEAVDKLIQRYDILTGYYAGAVPALQDADARLLLMSIALVNAQQGGFLRTAIGEDPTPATFVEPITLEDAETRIEEFEGA